MNTSTLDLLQDLFNKKWDSSQPNYQRSDGETMWSFKMRQMGVEKILIKNWEAYAEDGLFNQMRRAREKGLIVIADPSCIGIGQGQLALTPELAERILVLGYLP